MVLKLFFLSLVKDETLFKRYTARVDEQFFQRCDQELIKINTFFSGKQSILVIPVNGVEEGVKSNLNCYVCETQMERLIQFPRRLCYEFCPNRTFFRCGYRTIVSV
jgi:hypothetical protein